MRTRVKICGVTRVEDARLAIELGADALGFVFWPGSPRFLDPVRARRIVRALPPLPAIVGVFVDQPLSYVKEAASYVTLGAVQLHGAEPPEYVRALRPRVIKAVSLDEATSRPWLDSNDPHVTLLLDAQDPARKGGTGRPIDWHAAAGVARLRPILLAGGLTPDNVGRAIGLVQPYAVDVSSGVEARPGIKDPGRLTAFFDAVRDAEARITATGAAPEALPGVKD